jgi:CRISPR system Cascade subunit CasC
MNRFLQIHTLTSYPASLLNRDDAGFAKRIPFGGSVRTRISSQCLKRHWRTFDGEDGLAGLGVDASVRSRVTFEQLVVKPLTDGGVDAEVARAVTRALVDVLLGKSAKAEKQQADDEAKEEKKGAAKSAEGEEVKTGQITVLGRPEVSYLLDLARSICADKPAAKDAKSAVEKKLGKDGLKNMRQLPHAAGLDAAMFGRMVTSDNLARCDAAIHVGHAFTVHAEATESDYFSAIDELLKAGDEDTLGSGHINSSELTSGLFYGYVAIDVPLLVSNLVGVDRKAWGTADRTLAAGAVERLVKMIATVSPGAKLGATAPHAYAQLALVEAGNAQPRTLANAFLQPVAVSSSRPDLLGNAFEAVGAHIEGMDATYGDGFQRKLATVGPRARLGATLQAVAGATLPELAAWAAAKVKEA